jgi:hypothetical protein
LVFAAGDPDGADAEDCVPALRQTEGLIGSIIGLLGLVLAVPDQSGRSGIGMANLPGSPPESKPDRVAQTPRVTHSGT